MSRLRQEAIQEISSREQKILQQSKVIDTLGSENLLLSQRLADLERPHPWHKMFRYLRMKVMKVKILRIPGYRGKMSLDVTSRLDHRLPKFKGLVMPHVSSSPKDAALGASGSSSSDLKVADIKSDAKRVQIQDGDPRATGCRSDSGCKGTCRRTGTNVLFY